MGAWVSYGLGSDNQNLPAFVVLISQANSLTADQPLYSRLWGAGFLSSRYQGSRFRSTGDPVLYLADPPGIDKPMRRADAGRACGTKSIDGAILWRPGDRQLASRSTRWLIACRAPSPS